MTDGDDKIVKFPAVPDKNPEAPKEQAVDADVIPIYACGVCGNKLFLVMVDGKVSCCDCHTLLINVHIEQGPPPGFETPDTH